MKTETSVFPKRVVLAEGYPWVTGVNADKYFEINMRNQAQDGLRIPLEFPEVLWNPDLPKYRLVLEVIE
jgi:hypothetical protein